MAQCHDAMQRWQSHEPKPGAEKTDRTSPSMYDLGPSAITLSPCRRLQHSSLPKRHDLESLAPVHEAWSIGRARNTTRLVADCRHRTIHRSCETPTNSNMEIKPENCKQRLSRKSKNAWTKCVGFTKKSDLLAKMQVAEAKRNARKRLFGVQYMDHVEQNSPPEVLQRCIDLARADLDKLQEDIAELKAKIASVEEETKAKLVRKHGRRVTPSVHVTDADPPSSASTPTACYAETGLSNDDPQAFCIPHDSYFPSAPSAEFDQSSKTN